MAEPSGIGLDALRARPEGIDVALEAPFATHVSVMSAPWNDAARLMHIGIKSYVPDRSAAPPANLVFLIDTSGSMDEPNKLPLLVRSFKLLLTALAPEDRVAIVAYAGTAGVVLPPTPVAERGTVLAGLERLDAAGSTAGAEGIREAYRLAEQHFVAGGVNRVILATDGDFNVGISDPDALEDYIARKRSSGVSLSVLGFGMGNYNDELMQRLAQNGNGNAAYIDSLSEARKVLLEEAASTLVTIAKDVKIQVEFNPAAVSEYRLIGYETRMLAREDFRNDRVDAGEIGAGHTVTAIYELTPPGAGGERIAPLRYQDGGAEPGAGFDCELAFLKLRYKLPDAESSTLITRPVTVAGETPVDGTPAAVEADDENRPWLGGGFPSAQGRLHRLGSMAPRPARPTHESLCGVGARSFMCPTTCSRIGAPIRPLSDAGQTGGTRGSAQRHGCRPCGAMPGRSRPGGEWKERSGRSWRSPGFGQTDVHPVVFARTGVSGGVDPRINGEQRVAGTTRCRAGRQDAASRQASSRRSGPSGDPTQRPDTSGIHGRKRASGHQSPDL